MSNQTRPSRPVRPPRACIPALPAVSPTLTPTLQGHLPGEPRMGGWTAASGSPGAARCWGRPKPPRAVGAGVGEEAGRQACVQRVGSRAVAANPAPLQHRPGPTPSRHQRVSAAAPGLCLPVPQPPGWLPLSVPAGPHPPPRRQGLHPAGAGRTKRDHRQPLGPLGAPASAPRPHLQWLLPRLGLPPARPRSPEQRWPGLVPHWLHPAERGLHR